MGYKSKIKKVLSIITGVSCCILVIYLFAMSQINIDREPTLWGTVVPIVLSCCVIVGVFLFMNGDSVVRKYIRYKRWDSFGNRMKVAYSAKFGGRNPAFDEAVDQHVLAMKSLGKGYTKTIDKEWMKRMAKFVEVPFVIPEEERLSEEDKTRSFSKI
jgi:hypothetical protein